VDWGWPSWGETKIEEQKEKVIVSNSGTKNLGEVLDGLLPVPVYTGSSLTKKSA